jgi:sporulation protein YlmC with PRC-barrel domain
MIRYLAAVLVTGALVAAPAFAQTPQSNAMTAAAGSATMHKDGQWRASRLVGVDVYNDNNEKIGDINEVILNKSGKVDAVILGVGGFLGVGEHYVAVPMERLKWVNEPVRNASSSPAAGTVDKPTVAVNNAGAVTGEVNRFNRPQRAVDERWYPDHAVFNATKDQLKAMPQFRY